MLGRKFILGIITILILLSSCETKNNLVDKRVETVLKDILVDGVSIFRFQADIFNKDSYSVAIYTNIICVDSVVEYDYNQVLDLNSTRSKIDTTNIKMSKTDFIFVGDEVLKNVYFSKHSFRDFIVNKDLDAFLVFYTSKDFDGKTQILVTIRWIKNYVEVLYSFKEEEWLFEKREVLN